MMGGNHASLSLLLMFVGCLLAFSSCAVVHPHPQQQQVDAAATPSRDLIINGKDTRRGRFPYFSTLDRYCGGALVAPDIVLTAGHCKPATRKIKLNVGTYHYQYHSNEYEEFDIVHMVRHPNFKRLGDDEFRNDFTILQLNRTTSIPYVSVNRNPDIPAEGQQVTAMGLGTLVPGSSDKRPDVLQEVELTCISNKKCSNESDPLRNMSFHDRIVPSHLCTFTQNRDSCAYDSGGPIIIPGGVGGKNDLLVGLVSWGIDCADPVFAGVNARVGAVSDWIDELVCEFSTKPPSDFNCRKVESSLSSLRMCFFLLGGATVIGILILTFARKVYHNCTLTRSKSKYIALFETAETQSFNSASSGEDGAGQYNSIEIATGTAKFGSRDYDDSHPSPNRDLSSPFG